MKEKKVQDWWKNYKREDKEKMHDKEGEETDKLEEIITKRVRKKQ